eukprot:1127785-Prymnesium_polylepis.1
MAGLNMSNTDLAVHLHFALFNSSGGYMLKPPAMLHDATHPLTSQASSEHTPSRAQLRPQLSSASSLLLLEASESNEAHEEDYWPEPSETIHRTTVDILALHRLPKVCAHRPPIHYLICATRPLIFLRQACPHQKRSTLTPSSLAAWRATAIVSRKSRSVPPLCSRAERRSGSTQQAGPE